MAGRWLEEQERISPDGARAANGRAAVGREGG